jgi:aldehyde dehydrogenase (NAD+)
LLYVYSADRSVQREFEKRTSSGALDINVALAHMSVPDLPFGGVGLSGSGAYHGKRSFDVFSHQKAILSKPLAPDTLTLIYPPYTASKGRLARGILRKLSK